MSSDSENSETSILLSKPGLVILTLIVVLVVHIITQVILVIYRRNKEIIALASFPGPPPHWLYGNLRECTFGKNHIDRVKWKKQHGEAYVVHMGPTYRSLALASPRAVQGVITSSEPKDSIAYPFLKPWIGDGLLLSTGKKWARNRRLLTTAFHFDILKPYQAIFSEKSNVLISKWEKKVSETAVDESIQICEDVNLMTLDSLIKCIFGIDKNVQSNGENDPYIKTVHEIGMLFISRLLNPLLYFSLIYYFSSNGRKFRKACSILQEFSKSVIQRKKKEKMLHPGFILSQKKYLDFMDILIECKDPDGNGLTDSEIQDEVDTFMFAGHETTASAVSWCLYNLAKHPQYQEKCRQEVNDVLGDRNEVTWDDLSKLTYLTMCIKESLRVSPPAPGIGRETTQPHTLYDGRTIPTGTLVNICNYACHMDQEYWPNPDEFDPERFSAEASQGRHPYAFIPFSAGPRNCIGQHFAMNELKTTIALVLKKFYLCVDENKVPEHMALLVLRSKDGICLKLKPVE